MSQDNGKYGGGSYRQSVRALSYLLAGNFQTVGLLVFAWYVGGYLDAHFARDFSWQRVTFPAAIVVVFYTWFILLRTLIRIEKSGGDEMNKKNE